MRKMPVNDFAAKVKAAREEQRLSRPDLSRLSGVSPNTLERLEGSEHPPKPKRPTVIDLSHVLGLDVDAELAALGYEPLTKAERARLPDLADPWPELEQLWPSLTPQQKQALVGLVKAFVEGRKTGHKQEPMSVMRLGRIVGAPEPDKCGD